MQLKLLTNTRRHTETSLKVGLVYANLSNEGDSSAWSSVLEIARLYLCIYYNHLFYIFTLLPKYHYVK